MSLHSNQTSSPQLQPKANEEPPLDAALKNKEEPEKRFSLVRSLHLADFITLANGACGFLSILASMSEVAQPNAGFIWYAVFLIPLGAVMDVLDGYVARWFVKTSLLGQEMDSLSDLVKCTLIV